MNGNEFSDLIHERWSNLRVLLDISHRQMTAIGSGSMSETECSEGKRKIEVARTALASFAGSVPGQANLGLAVFDAKGLSERLPLGPDNRDAFRQAVAAVKRNLREAGYGKAKVGHGGTLDPLASGVLPIAIGDHNLEVEGFHIEGVGVRPPRELGVSCTSCAEQGCGGEKDEGRHSMSRTNRGWGLHQQVSFVDG